MPVTLLVSHPKWTWRDWLKENLDNQDLLVLDPSSPDHGPPARCSLVRAGKTIRWQLVGHTDVQRNPIAFLSAASALARESRQDLVVQLFPMRLSPVLRQLALTVAQIFEPSKVLVPAQSRFEMQPWVGTAETVELPEAFPATVQDAQRRATWIDLQERCEFHKVDLAEIGIHGTRLGSGVRLKHTDFNEFAEVSGGVLHVITDREIEDDEVSRAMNLTHASRVSIVSPRSYERLICSFADKRGRDFGMGFIESIDPREGTAEILCEAVVPAPVKNLRIGTLQVSPDGQEVGSLNLWTV
ncbi:hypothetical protein QPK87_14035 [Kamptonema cortianum]|nr:hypothetical protein [Geitlerinema splendidum]MDK3157687.1 hypothetical protein [Kamptonema cortianum]